MENICFVLWLLLFPLIVFKYERFRLKKVKEFAEELEEQNGSITFFDIMQYFLFDIVLYLLVAFILFQC